MMQAATIGLDIAKAVFQVHGVDAGGQVLVRKRSGSLLPACTTIGRLSLKGGSMPKIFITRAGL
jgi:hypothetical protein